MRFVRLSAAGCMAASVAAAFCLAAPGGMSAAAQTMAHPTAKPATPAATPSAAPAAPDDAAADPAKVAAARDFLKAYRPRLDPAYVAAEMDKYRQQVADAMKKQNPKANVKAVMDQRRAEVLARITKQLDKQANMIAPYFTVQELKELTAFFSHGVGKKLTDITPKIQMEMIRRQRVARQLKIPGKSGAVQLNSATPAKPSAPPKK